MRPVVWPILFLLPIFILYMYREVIPKIVGSEFLLWESRRAVTRSPTVSLSWNHRMKTRWTTCVIVASSIPVHASCMWKIQAGGGVLDFPLWLFLKYTYSCCFLFASLFQTDTNKSRTQNLRPQVLFDLLTLVDASFLRIFVSIDWVLWYWFSPYIILLFLSWTVALVLWNLDTVLMLSVLFLNDCCNQTLECFHLSPQVEKWPCLNISQVYLLCLIDIISPFVFLC